MNIYLNAFKQLIDIKLLLLYNNAWNHLTVCKKQNKQLTLFFKNKCYQQNVYKSHVFNIHV